MQAINLPTELLRSFLAIVDLGGYTRAAEMLGRTQPAMSLQMRRLEALLDTRLIVVSRRGVTLTEEGETLAVYARRLLRINDEAVARFTGADDKAEIRIGLPTDYALAFLQDTVARFSADRPGLPLAIHCDQSFRLLDRLHQDELDMCVALMPTGDDQYLVSRWQEQPVWVMADDDRRDLANGAIALVCHPEGCEYRNRMIAALSRERRDWRIAYSSPEIAGLQAAVLAGLGVSALTAKTMKPGMRAVTAHDGLPMLDPLRIGLFHRARRASTATLDLVRLLSTAVDEAAGT